MCPPSPPRPQVVQRDPVEPLPPPPPPERTAEEVQEGGGRTQARNERGQTRGSQGTQQLRIQLQMAESGGQGVNVPAG